VASVISGYTQSDRQELQKRLTSARAFYAKLVKVAPDEVTDAVKTVVKIVDIVIDAVAQHPDDQAAVSEQIGLRLGDGKDAQAASALIVSVTKEQCGLDLTPTRPGASTGGGATTTTTDASGSGVTTTTGG
jgi:hypothetical protein